MKRVVLLAAALTACGGPLEPGPNASREAVQYCPTSYLAGVDVSDGNGTIDWAQVHGANIAFAYMKATQGTGFTASTFASNWANSKANGVYRGAYHFFDPNQDGVAQANYFLSVMGPLSPGDLPPALDAECPDGDPACLGYTNNTWPTGDVIHQRILDFLTTVEAATGRKPIIYTFPSYFSGYPIPDSDLGGYPLWLANVAGTGCYDTPTPWTSAVIWQWDWHGTVAGISGQVDQDRFIGDLTALQAFAAGAPPRLHRTDVSDLDGDGRSDLCARGPNGMRCWLASDGGFGPGFDGPTLDDASGWSDPKYYATIQFADVTGDGRSDLCARTATGLRCWPSNGAGFDAPFDGPTWSDASGWDQAPYYETIQLADLDGDGKADACGRSAAGLRCYLSNGSGFPTAITGPAMSDANDWGAPKYYETIRFPDLDGDGKADVCARASAGIVCWRFLGSAFDTTMLTGPSWSDASGWDQPRYYQSIAYVDVNGDGKADVCGRGPNGVECWLSDGSGFPTHFAGPAWTGANGWDALSSSATVQFADVNGDGKADVCGRSSTGIECWLSDGQSFATQLTGPGLSDTGGWNNIQYFWTIELGDVSGDGKADLCARGYAGYFCWPSTGSGFGAQQSTSGLGDPDGFGELPYYPTVELVGGKPASAVTTTTGSSSGASSSGGSTGTGTTTGGSAGSTSGSAGATTGSGSSSGTSGSASASGGSSGASGKGAAKGGCSSADGAGLLGLFVLALLLRRRDARR